MPSPDQIAEARQARLIRISDTAEGRGAAAWRRVDFGDLDASWTAIEPALTAQVVAAQIASARGSDAYTANLSRSYDVESDRSATVPEAFAGADTTGRPVSSLLHGAVTTTKQAVRGGLGAVQAMEAGATYLAAMLKTVLADTSRSSDMVSSVGRGYVRYVRVVEPGACSRCMVLAGSDRFSKPFQRHPECRCTSQPLPVDDAGVDVKGPEDLFDELTAEEQDRRFGRAGAQAIRDGASVSQVVTARRGMGRPRTYSNYSRMKKTTIGRRPNGEPVQVYATTEATTKRGGFGRQQSEFTRRSGARYTSSTRVRLMPESILEIAGEDTELRQAFLRDAGYLQYVPKNGYDRGNRWMAEVAEMRQQDRITVDQATIRYGNFTLGR